MKENQEILNLVQMVIEFEDESPLTDAELAQIAAIKSILGATPKLSLIKELSKQYNDARDALVWSDIPTALASRGYTEVSIDGGVKVKVAKVYNTKTIDADKAAQYLESIGRGSIIKDALEFEKGDFNEEAQAALADLGIGYSRKSAINGAQFKKAIIEEIEGGTSTPPADAVEVKIHNEAKITLPKGGF